MPVTRSTWVPKERAEKYQPGGRAGPVVTGSSLQVPPPGPPSRVLPKDPHAAEVRAGRAAARGGAESRVKPSPVRDERARLRRFEKVPFGVGAAGDVVLAEGQPERVRPWRERGQRRAGGRLRPSPPFLVVAPGVAVELLELRVADLAVAVGIQLPDRLAEEVRLPLLHRHEPVAVGVDLGKPRAVRLLAADPAVPVPVELTKALDVGHANARRLGLGPVPPSQREDGGEGKRRMAPHGARPGLPGFAGPTPPRPVHRSLTNLRRREWKTVYAWRSDPPEALAKGSRP